MYDFGNFQINYEAFGGKSKNTHTQSFELLATGRGIVFGMATGLRCA